MVTINNSTLRSNVYETIYDTLNGASLLSGTATVTASYYDDDQAFPQVVVNPVDVAHSEHSFNWDHSKKNVSIMIDIWTKKNKDKDLLCDEIDALLRPLAIAGLSLINWEESNAFESPGNNKLHLKSITLTYLRG